MEKVYGMHKLVGLQLFWSGTPTFCSGTPTFCQMGVLNSCFQNPSESSANEYRTYLNLPVGTPAPAGNILVGGGFGRMGGYLTPVMEN